MRVKEKSLVSIIINSYYMYIYVDNEFPVWRHRPWLLTVLSDDRERFRFLIRLFFGREPFARSVTQVGSLIWPARGLKRWGARGPPTLPPSRPIWGGSWRQGQPSWSGRGMCCEFSGDTIYRRMLETHAIAIWRIYNKRFRDGHIQNDIVESWRIFLCDVYRGFSIMKVSSYLSIAARVV